MRLLPLPHRAIGVLLFVSCCLPASAHDTSVSYATIRFKPEALELQIKIAAETAWAVAAPGAELLVETFETDAKPRLLAFAPKMEELSVDGKLIPPRQITVELSEDNFIFTFVYPRPTRPAVLRENYLTLMPADYSSRVVIVDQDDEPVSVKTLRAPEITHPIIPSSPAAKTPAAPPPAKR